MRWICVLLLVVILAVACGSTPAPAPTVDVGATRAVEQAVDATVEAGREAGRMVEVRSCHDRLRRELVLQPNANTADRMNQVVRVIQEREEDCAEDEWAPVVDVTGYANRVRSGDTAFSPDDVRGSCFETESFGTGNYTVDGLRVPARLMTEEGGQTVPSAESVRGVSDNILVYFDVDGLPTDLSRCWLYLARDRLWVSFG